jgi:hypothetical protein
MYQQTDGSFIALLTDSFSKHETLIDVSFA